jgi:hypothetical protein
MNTTFFHWRFHGPYDARLAKDVHDSRRAEMTDLCDTVIRVRRQVDRLKERGFVGASDIGLNDVETLLKALE